MSAPTPGPLYLHRARGGQVYVMTTREIDDNEPAVATFWPGDDPQERAAAYANALLFVAAPDLLTAAKESVALLDKGTPGWGVSRDLLRAAIAKAEGK